MKTKGLSSPAIICNLGEGLTHAEGNAQYGVRKGIGLK